MGDPILQPSHALAVPLPRGVRRALDAMQADAARDWSLDALAEVAGLSNRTLQRQFRVFLGQTPLAKLRDIRFDRARRELLRPAAGVRVMDIALRCGFPHFGRFSIEYRRRYGETPSQTVRRQATVVDALASMRMPFVIGRDRPTIALTTFEAGIGDSEAARAIADELATSLTRAGVSVVSQARGARYRLAGALRGSGHQARLTLRLIEADTGRHLWAHRSEGAGDRDFMLEEHHATRIVAALQPHLRQAEVERARRQPDSDLSAQDLALRALPSVLAMDAEGNARALDLLERALERDPEHALATSLAAWAHAQRVVYHFSPTPLEERARGMELVGRASALAGDATALALLGNALTSLNEVESADLVIRKALAVDGGSAWAWSRGGWIDVYRGDSDSAIERFGIALELAPQDPLAFNNLMGIGVAHFNAGRYQEAARWQNWALREHPSA
ncbi:MAG TPA: helix-turn-helix domain-containing protein, partial [Stellaceae bacterium]|nr:helix-turn-helix domain-containing protein [Stellaceae bacterium]